jgi:hypothetical protein
MQASFHCPWCQTRKPLASGFRQMGPRRRKCLQCCRNTRRGQHEPTHK